MTSRPLTCLQEYEAKIAALERMVGRQALGIEFLKGGSQKRAIAQSWRRNWNEVIPFFAFRRIIYTTNAIESLNAKLRKAVKARGHFPNDDAALKLLFLVMRNVAREWKMAPREWNAAKTQFCHHLRR